jgi:hypothetical protein
MSNLKGALQALSNGNPAGASVAAKLLSQPAVPQQQALPSVVTVSTINIGNKLRIRATSDGGVLEVLSVDGTIWLPHQIFKQT